ncbi:MAG: hypothetical protein JO286_03475 [Solirubrobacterales bacterium]|nr:hypothetical protein [Solirubrobacterales bacterium]MBV9684768.1 hypothetical protein [Solirubrobacterales bacterium]MBV9806215.1 hypothetical protein [Solirubrobacterales bacterium]
MPGASVIAGAATLLSYLGHYLVARLLYDDLVRPVAHGDGRIAILLGVIGGVAYALGRRSGRQR